MPYPVSTQLPRLLSTPHLHSPKLPPPRLNPGLLQLHPSRPHTPNTQIIAQPHPGLPTRLLRVFPQLLARNHDGDRGFGDQVVGEGAQEDAFEGGAATAAKDDERRVEGVDLFVC